MVKGINTKVKNVKNQAKNDAVFDVYAPKNEYREEVSDLEGLTLDRKDKKDQDRFFKESILEPMLDLLEKGQTLEDAARVLYLEPSIARRWYDENFKNFRFAVEQAESYAKYTQIHKVVKGFNGWTAAGWWLERRYPFEYLKKDKEEKELETPKDQIMKIGNQIIKF